MTMPRLVVRFLGTPSIEFDGRPLKLPTPARCVAVLATLALRRNDPPTRSTLAAAIWPDDLDSDARANLRRHLHLIVQALPKIDGVDWIDTTSRAAAWNERAPAWFDVCEFEELAGDKQRREEAIALYGGDLLATWPDEFLIADRERLRSVYLNACFDAAVAARRDSRLTDAVAHVERILAVDEWREDALRLAMTIEYESADRSGALARFQRFVDRLDAAMGVDPMPETLALRDAILSGVPASANTPFVGRRAEFAALESAWRNAARGRGAVVFVSGDAGAGKTRLITEFCATVSAQGGRALYGETSNPQAYPYEPIVEALRRGISMIADAPPGAPWLSALSELLPELHARIAGIAAPKPLEAGEAQKRLFEAIERTVERIARSRPLVLVLEDLHWAHSATLQSIEALASRIATIPVAIVATYRTGEVTPGHELQAVRRRLHGQRLATSIDVPPMRDHEVAELVAKLGHKAPGDELSASVYRGSEGNALFASLLLRNYAETGTVPAAGVAPGNIAETILERTSSLDGPSRALLDAAATAGRTFTTDVLAGILNWSEGAIFDALGSLLDRGFVRTSGNSAYAYAFSHALIEATIYSSLPFEERAATHRRIAELLETSDAARTETLPSIARHWKSAGDRAHAAHAFARAAEASLEVYARDAAIEYAREAIALEDDLARRFVAMTALVKAGEHYAAVERWNEDLSALESAAIELGDAERYTAIEARARYYAQTGERERERALIDEMLAMATKTRSVERTIDALSALGVLHVGLGDFRGAIERFRDALPLALASGDRRRVSRVRQHLTVTSMRSGDVATAQRELAALRAEHGPDAPLQERLDLLWAESSLGLATEDPELIGRVGDELLLIAERIGDQETSAKAHWLRAWAASVRGDVVELRAEYAKAAEEFERLQQPQSLAATYVNLGVHYFNYGVLDRAAELNELGAEFAERAGTRIVMAFALANIADIERLRGRLEQARVLAVRAMDVAGPTGDQRSIGNCKSVLGMIEIAGGKSAEGNQLLREAVGTRRTLMNAESLVEDLSRLINGLLDCGESAEAAGLGAELEDLAGTIRPTTKVTLAYVTLARLAREAADAIKERSFEERARSLFVAQRDALPDEESREAFAALPYYRALTGRATVS